MLKRGVFKGRCGQETISYWLIIDIVVLSVLIAALFFFIKGAGEDRGFERSALSKDAALCVDVLQSLPGSAHLGISHALIDMTNYDFMFDKYTVYVQDSGAGLKSFYPYYDDHNLVNSYAEQIRGPKTIYMQKAAGELRISGEAPAIVSKKECGKASSTASSTAKTDTIYLVYQTELLRPVAEGVKTTLELKKISSILMTYEDMQKMAAEKSAPAFTLGHVVILSPSKNDGQQGLFYVYYLNMESAKLACQISNAFLENENEPRDSLFLKSTTAGIPAEAGVALVIEFSLPKGPLSASEAAMLVAQAVSSGIHNYEVSAR